MFAYTSSSVRVDKRHPSYSRPMPQTTPPQMADADMLAIDNNAIFLAFGPDVFRQIEVDASRR